MPKFPDFSHRVKQIPGSVFEKFKDKLSVHKGNVINLHIGDTYLLPEYNLPLESAFVEAHRDLNRYCDTFGVSSLRDVLVEKIKNDNHLSVEKNNLLLTCGATNALSVSTMALIEPDEDILLLTPAWPLFFNIVKFTDGNIIEVPIYVKLYENPEMDIQEYLGKFLTSKTVAIYVNTPNNPSGKMLNTKQLNQIAEFAYKNKLWILSDEAYDGITFDNNEHISLATIPNIFEQTISVFTFSKLFMFAGLRLGYAVATETVIKNLNKLMVHQIYSPSTINQYMMIEPVKTRYEWSPSVKKHYQKLRDIFVDNFKVKFNIPEGTYYLFFSIKDILQGRDYWQVIDELLANAVPVAPGGDFGRDFKDYIRICFTGEPEEKLIKAIEKLNKIL